MAWIATAAALASARPEPVAGRLLVERRGTILQVDPRTGGTRMVLRSTDAAWNPDGTLVAYVSGGDVWVANSDGSGRRRLTSTPHVVESQLAWSADGRALAYTALAAQQLSVRILRLPYGASRLLATAAWSPAFAPNGEFVAYASDRAGPVELFEARVDASHARPFGPRASPAVADVRDLAWSPQGGRVAYTEENQEGFTRVVAATGRARTVVRTDASHPIWSPDGRSLAMSPSTGGVELVALDGGKAVPRGKGVPLDWRRVPLGRPRFPDLRQRPPTGLTVWKPYGRWLLGFTSLVDNMGPGTLWIHASRPAGSPLMTAVQRIALGGGGVRTVRGAGYLHYVDSPPHHHWHLLGYDRYTLRRASDFAVVVRDHKSGFCLADHYGIAPDIRHVPAHFTSLCGQFEPWLRRVDEGTSVGWTDRYPAFFHGQQLDLTGVRAGLYWLVHQVNSRFGLRERNYGNDTASVLVRIAWRGGRPSVRRLRSCLAERC